MLCYILQCLFFVIWKGYNQILIYAIKKNYTHTCILEVQTGTAVRHCHTYKVTIKDSYKTCNRSGLKQVPPSALESSNCKKEWAGLHLQQIPPSPKWKPIVECTHSLLHVHTPSRMFLKSSLLPVFHKFLPFFLTDASVVATHWKEFKLPKNPLFEIPNKESRKEEHFLNTSQLMFVVKSELTMLWSLFPKCSWHWWGGVGNFGLGGGEKGNPIHWNAEPSVSLGRTKLHYLILWSAIRRNLPKSWWNMPERGDWV